MPAGFGFGFGSGGAGFGSGVGSGLFGFESGVVGAWPSGLTCWDWFAWFVGMCRIIGFGFEFGFAGVGLLGLDS